MTRNRNRTSVRVFQDDDDELRVPESVVNKRRLRALDDTQAPGEAYDAPVDKGRGQSDRKKKKATGKSEGKSKHHHEKPDLRKQLFNEGKLGCIEEIQVSTERIVQLRGILFDLDPGSYIAGPFTRSLSRDPEKFYDRVVRSWLDRQPILKNCEVRVSGTGLHAILWFKSPIKFQTDGDRNRWAGIVKVVQAALPIDPDQPGITATTRALGSINSKNGTKVRRLTKGKPVAEEDVLGLFNEMCSAPFKTVCGILTGKDSISPCPLCGGEDTKLAAQDYAGSCYGSCGKVKLESLYDSIFAPRVKVEPAKKEKGHHAKKAK